MGTLNDLMIEYKNLRGMESDDDDLQEIHPPSLEIDDYILALDGVTKYKLSPMLIERFRFCSRWDNAYLSQNFLSLEEINKRPYSKTLEGWISLRGENWDHVPPKSIGNSKCSIFSYNPFEPEEIYLDWSVEQKEPRVWHYFGADFYMFNSLERFFLYMNGKIGDEDTIREHV